MSLIRQDIQISKELIEQERQSIKDKVDNGEIDPLKVNAAIAFYTRLIDGDPKKKDGLKYIVREGALQEYAKYGEKQLKKWGCEIVEAETGAKYDYTNCNDPIWNDLAEQEEEIKKKKAAREKFLKAIQKRQMIVDEDTGDVIELNPPGKTSTTSLKFSIK